MSTPLTLDAVKSEFDHWRQQKSAPQSRIPQVLKDKAVALRDQYNTQQIVAALRINLRRFISWENAPGLSDTTDSVARDFVRLPMEPLQTEVRSIAPAHSSDNNHPHITCQHPSGAQWCIQGNFTTEQLNAVVSALNSGVNP